MEGSLVEHRNMDDASRYHPSTTEPHPHLTPLTPALPATSLPTTPPSSLLDISSYNQTSAVVTSPAYPLDLHPAPSAQPAPPPHYPHYTDLDWQGAGVHVSTDAAAHQGTYYAYPADHPDLATVQMYHPHAFPATHTDLYASSPALWHHAAPPPPPAEDRPPPALISQRGGGVVGGGYLPSLARTSGSSSGGGGGNSSGSSCSSSTGKPKRRRVQSLPQRKAANVRERRRMFHLNTAFDELRKRLPAFNYEKRLSRIETLRLAMTYIGFMKDVTMGEDPRNIKLRPSSLLSDTGSDLSHVDMGSCTSEDPHHDDLDN